MNAKKSKNSNVIVILGVLFIIWNILGIIDSKNYSYSGYTTDDNFTINRVEPDSPAESAGLLEGDVIKSTGGIAVTDSKGLNKRSRAEIGETREIVVERNGEEMSVQLTYAERPEKDQTNNLIGSIIGLLFIIIGVYSNYKFKSDLSCAFAAFALSFGFIFSGGPNISASIIDTIVDIVSASIFLYAFTSLAIFMLKYPPESNFTTSKNFKLIYTPMAILLLVIIILELLQPDSSGALNMTMRLLWALFIIFYFGWSLITLIRKYMSSNAEERNTQGHTMMLIGSIIGLLPILIIVTVNAVSPGVDIPGGDYVFITLAAIPIFYYLALNKLHNSSVQAD